MMDTRLEFPFALLISCAVLFTLSSAQDFNFQPSSVLSGFTFDTNPPRSPDFEPSENACRDLSPAVTQFASDFRRGVSANQNLTRAFNLKGLTAKEAGLIYKSLVYYVHRAVGSQDAPLAADIVQKAVQKNFKKFTSTSLVEIVGNSVGEVLEVLGQLTAQTASKFSKQLVQQVVKGVQLVPVQDPQLELVNVIDGVTDFLKVNKLFAAENALVIASLFAKQIYEL